MDGPRARTAQPRPSGITAALAALSDGDLAQLRSLADDAHGQSAGLLAAISHAADWEFHRRGGLDFEMLPLGDALPRWWHERWRVKSVPALAAVSTPTIARLRWETQPLRLALLSVAGVLDPREEARGKLRAVVHSGNLRV